MYEKKSSLDLDPRSKLTCSATFVSRIEFQGSNADTSLLVHIILLLGNSYNISWGIPLQLMMSILEHIIYITLVLILRSEAVLRSSINIEK